MLMALMLLCAGQVQGPVKMAVPGLSLSGVETKLGEAYVERFATLLGRDPRLKVTTKRDIEAVLGFERQKALMGCNESSTTCLAELAGGLGVDALLSGSLAKAGSGYIVTMRVVRAGDGAEVASISERLKSEDALIEWFETEAPKLADQVAIFFGRTKPTKEAHLERWIPALAGAACIAAGVAMQAGARGDAQLLNAGTVPLANTQSVLERGKAVEAGSWVLFGVGAAAIAASVVWVAVGSSPAKVAVVPIEGGAVFSLAGTLP
jgi:hypothetical protein